MSTTLGKHSLPSLLNIALTSFLITSEPTANINNGAEASETEPQAVLPPKSTEAVVAVNASTDLHADVATGAKCIDEPTPKADGILIVEPVKDSTSPLPAPTPAPPASTSAKQLYPEVDVAQPVASGSGNSAPSLPLNVQVPPISPITSCLAPLINDQHMEGAATEVDQSSNNTMGESEEAAVAPMEDVEANLPLMDGVEDTPVGMDDVQEVPLMMADVEETPLAMEDVKETPLGMDDVEETPLGMDDITATSSSALNAPSTPTNNTTTTGQASALNADAMDGRQDAEGVPVNNIEAPTTSTYPVPSQQLSTLPTNTNATASSSTTPFPVNQAPATIPQWRLSEFREFTTRRREGLRSIWADKGFDNGDEFVDAYVEDEQQLEDNDDNNNDEYDDEQEEYYEEGEDGEEEEYSEHVSFLDDLEAAFLEEAEEEAAAAAVAAADVEEEL